MWFDVYRKVWSQILKNSVLVMAPSKTVINSKTAEN